MKYKTKGPVRVGNIIADLLSRKGLGRPQATIQLEQVWVEVVGDAVARMTHCGKIQRQQLHVIVTNSALMQDLTFRKQEILTTLNSKNSGPLIKDIRFRIGRLPAR